MAVQLQFEIEGEKQVSAVLGITADHVKNFRKPMERIAGELQKSFQMNFSSRGALFMPGGWPPRARYYPWPILEKTGLMRRSFREEVHDDYVVMFNSTPYFRYHQSNRPRKRLPRRVMMKIDEQRRNFIFKELQAHILSGMQGRKAQNSG